MLDESRPGRALEQGVFQPKSREIVKIPVFEYGNGIQLEKRIIGKSSDSSINIASDGLDVVKIHFLPRITSGEIVHLPTQVPQAERGKIRIDAISGCIMLAEAIASNSLSIENHQAGQDYYLLVTTNPSMAFFFTSNCGFKGNSRDGFVYMLASEFSSPANIQTMKRLRDFLLDSNTQRE